MSAHDLGSSGGHGVARAEASAFPRDGKAERAPFALSLREVAREVPGSTLAGEASGDVLVRGVHHDSRCVEAGDLFVARPGSKSSGASFVEAAKARGAVAVLGAPGIDTAGLPLLAARDVPSALSYAAAAVYGHPTFALEVVGITGTNGKTTTAHLVQAVIDATVGKSGIVGTLGYRFGDLDLPSTHTSPEGDELARIASAMRARGATHLVMEVSSIALTARRADAVRFRVAAFTNLTQDHLDYHGSMEAYAEAKARLFTELGPGSAAINVDDAFGVELSRRLAPEGMSGPKEALLLRYSAKLGATPAEAEVAPTSLSQTTAGIEMIARTPAGPVRIRSPLLGAHNVSNLLCALAIGLLLDAEPVAVGMALSTSIPVPGRLERCDGADDDVAVLVDYAHTPDALARVLDSVRELGAGRVHCVFGCGGDRDPLKRPLMGKAVGERADVAVVTNDNPRSEDPEAIAEAILPGLEGSKAMVVVELDRRRAIDRAVLGASAGDVVLIAGKGHEPYQIIGAQTFAFDDRAEARRALAERRALGSKG